MVKGIPYFNNENYCPVKSLKKYINVCDLKKGKIFNISDKSVALLIKKFVTLAGFDPSKYADTV